MNLKDVNIVSVIFTFCLLRVATNVENLLLVGLSKQCLPTGIHIALDVICVLKNWLILVSFEIKIVLCVMTAMRRLKLSELENMCVKSASKIMTAIAKNYYLMIELHFFSGLIDEAPLRFRGEVYHGYHFNCTTCGCELDSTAREVKSRPGFAANDMVCGNKIIQKKNC